MANVRHPSYPAAPLMTVFMVLVVAWFALLATFHNHPTIDIDISSAFFSGPVCARALGDGACGYFPLRRLPLFEEIRRVLYILPYVAATLILITGLVGVVSREMRQYIPMGRLLVALISLGVGPGLVVNLLLKAHSGRPRPVQTNLFGGPSISPPRVRLPGSVHETVRLSQERLPGQDG